MLKRLALGLLTAWAAAGFLVEMNRALSAWDHRDRLTGPRGLRFGAPGSGDLARSLAAARPRLPPGAVVAFTGPDDPPSVALRYWCWTAYLLPDHDVIPVNDPAAGRLADYAIAYRREIHHPRAEPVLQLPDGWLYRVKRP